MSEPMKVTVVDLLDIVVDLTQRAYGIPHGVVDHCFESTGEWAVELLEALGVVVPIDGSRSRFEVRPRADWPALSVTVEVAFHRTRGTDGMMEARAPLASAAVGKDDE